MCIIIYHPEDTNMVSKQVLKHCWDKNSDGAGYSYWDQASKMWLVNKGFMSWSAFWLSFNAHSFSKQTTWIAHFRIATAGNTDGGNTHPFKICTNYDTMRIEKYRAKKIAFHNGVVGSGEDEASDTMFHIKTYIAPLFPSIHKKKINIIITHLCETNSNRWLLTNGATLFLFGDWETKDGVYYSNKSYVIVKTYISQYTNYNNYGNYNYDYYRNKRAEEEKENKEVQDKINKIKTNKLECPICGESEFVMDSAYNVGECTCYTCGCVFDETSHDVYFFEPIV